jgi:hypothetical protein
MPPGHLKASVVTFDRFVDQYGLYKYVTKSYSSQSFTSINNSGYSVSTDRPEFHMIDYGKVNKSLITRSNADVIRDTVISINGSIIRCESGLKLSSTIIVDSAGVLSRLRKENKSADPVPKRVILLFGRYKVCKNALTDMAKLINLDAFSYIVGSGLNTINGMKNNGISHKIKSIASNGGWIYPIDESTIEVGSSIFIEDEGITENTVTELQKKILKDSMNDIVYAFFCKKAQPLEPMNTRIIAYFPAKVATVSNIVYLGDSLGTGDPFLSTHCHRHAYIAEYLALVIKRAITNSDISILEDYQKIWNHVLNDYSKRRLIRAKSLFKLSIDQWDKILATKRKKTVTDTVESRIGTKKYSIKDAINRYPISLVARLLINELKFYVKYKVSPFYNYKQYDEEHSSHERILKSVGTSQSTMNINLEQVQVIT